VVLIGGCVVPIQDAIAQSPSLFPPPPGAFAGGDKELTIFENDRTPPTIEVTETDLRQGKNVLVVRIMDDSDLASREVKYVDDGRIKFADLGRDHGNVYHALINVDPPSSIVVIDVIDAAGNRATVTKEFNVVEGGFVPGDFLERIAYWWNSFLAFVGLG
jgi:hypothetical protein